MILMSINFLLLLKILFWINFLHAAWNDLKTYEIYFYNVILFIILSLALQTAKYHSFVFLKNSWFWGSLVIIYLFLRNLVSIAVSDIICFLCVLNYFHSLFSYSYFTIFVIFVNLWCCFSFLFALIKKSKKIPGIFSLFLSSVVMNFWWIL